MQVILLARLEVSESLSSDLVSRADIIKDRNYFEEQEAYSRDTGKGCHSRGTQT